MYEPNGHPHGHSHALPVHPDFASAVHGMDDKLAAAAAAAGWGHPGMYQQHQQQQHQQTIAQPQWAHQLPPQLSQQQQTHGMFTPPGTAGSTTSNGNVSPIPTQQQHFALAQGNGAQAFLPGLLPHSPLGHGHVYASPELDDVSSVGSGGGAARSVGGSPQPAPAFDLGAVVNGGAYGRRPSLSLNVASPVGAGGQWGVSPPAQPISAGGGGGGGGRYMNAVMMSF